MKRIDRLLMRAIEEYRQNSSGLDIAFVIEQEDGSWEAKGQLWDGKKGSGTQEVSSIHSTQEEAIEAINQLAEEYPSKEDLLIFIEDFGYNEGAAV